MAFTIDGTNGLTFPDSSTQATRAVARSGDTITGGLGIGAPATRMLSVETAGAEFSLVNTAAASGSRVFNMYLASGTANLRMLNDAQTAGNDAIQFDSAGRVRLPAVPAFSVYLSTIKGPSSQVILFDGVRLNNGNHYNTSTGRFTAPIPGRYFFSLWWLSDNNSSYGDVAFRKNSSVYYGRTRNAGSGGHETQSASCVIDLVANEWVDVYYDNMGQASNVYGDTSNSWTGFSGYLIG